MTDVLIESVTANNTLNCLIPLIKHYGISGSGTSDSPYLLTSIWDITLIGTDPYLLSSYYQLNNDINAEQTSHPDYESGKGFKPIETFTGKFNGNNKTITKLYINRDTETETGFFGQTTGAYVYDLTLTNVNIKGSTNTGAIIGKINSAPSGAIKNLSVTGEVTGTSYAGGIIGRALSVVDNLDNLDFNGSISGTEYVGGCVGAWENASGTQSLTNCTATGTITATMYVGGIAGWANRNVKTCSVTSMTITSNKAGDLRAGGIVGQISGNVEVTSCSVTDSTITDSTGDYIGGIVGYCGNYNLSVDYCSVDIDLTGHDYIGGIIGQATFCDYVLVVRNSSYTGTLSGNSYIGGIIGYQGHYNSSSIIEYCTISGIINATGNEIGGVSGRGHARIEHISISRSDLTINVSSTNDMVGGIVGYCGNHNLSVDYCGVDIDLTGRDYIGGIIGRTNYGNYVLVVRNSSYTGTLSGNSYIGGIIGYQGHYNASSIIEYCTVSDTIISVTTTKGGGIAGLACRNIKNCLVKKITITSSSNATCLGGLVGLMEYFYSEYFDNVVSNYNISGSSYLGGLVGDSSVSSSVNIIVYHCRTKGTVIGTGDYIGGLFGRLALYGASSIIRYCYSQGSIEGDEYVGGLCGSTYRIVQDCYSHCAVTGTKYVGGLLGYINLGTLTDSYSKGLVSAVSNGGGLVGGIGPDGCTATTSYWDTETSGMETSAAGTGKSTLEMTTLSTFESDWDFSTPIWVINSLNNNGYPYLYDTPLFDVLILSSITGSMLTFLSPIINNFYFIVLDDPRTAIDNIHMPNNFLLTDSRTAVDNILRAYYFSLIDSETTVDNILRAYYFLLSDSKTATDNILLRNSFSLIDSRTAIDNIIMPNNFSLIDSRTAIDSILLRNNLSLIDSKTSIDNILRAYYFSLIDSKTSIDNILRAYYFSLIDSKTVTDNILLRNSLSLIDLRTVIDNILIDSAIAFPSGWNYYKEYEQPGSSDGELTDYQVTITVPMVEGKMRNDYGDIRFALEDNTEIPYHLVSYDASSAVFVVKIPVLPIAGSTLRMYYGNPDATTTSDPENVYNAYITGENDETNLFTLVDIYNNGINASFTHDSVNHHYSLKVTSADNVFAKINSLDNKANLKLKANIYRYSNTGNNQGGLIARQKAQNTLLWGRYATDNSKLSLDQGLNGSFTEKDSDSYSFPQNQWFTVELVVVGSSANLYWYDSDEVLIHSESTSTLDASIDSGSWGLLGGYDTGSEVWFKNIVACEVTSNPPGDGVWGDEVSLIFYTYFRSKLKIVEETTKRFRSKLWIEPERVRFRTKLKIYQVVKKRFRAKLKTQQLNPVYTQIKKRFRAKIETIETEKVRFRGKLKINTGETRLELYANVVLKRSEFDLINPQFEFSIGGERYDS